LNLTILMKGIRGVYDFGKKIIRVGNLIDNYIKLEEMKIDLNNIVGVIRPNNSS